MRLEQQFVDMKDRLGRLEERMDEYLHRLSLLECGMVGCTYNPKDWKYVKVMANVDESNTSECVHDWVHTKSTGDGWMAYCTKCNLSKFTNVAPSDEPKEGKHERELEHELWSMLAPRVDKGLSRNECKEIIKLVRKYDL